MSHHIRGDIVPLGSLLETPPKNGYSPICPNEPTGKWVLGLSALSERRLDLSAAKPAPIDEPLVDRFLLHPGDFLISRSNTIDKVGRVGVFRGGLDNCSYPDLMMRFRPDTSKIYPDYLEVFLRSEAIVKYIKSHATGTSGSMKKINQAIVESIPILLPNPSAQKKIAAIHTIWDTVIEETERLIGAKQTFLSALYQRFFSPRRLKELSWKKYRLAQFLIVRSEKAVPSDETPLYSLTIEDGVTAKTDRYNRDFLVKDMKAKTYKVVHPGDIVFNPANLRWGAIARSELKHRVVVSPIYEVVSVDDEKVNPDLLTHALTCPQQIKIFALRVEGTLIERMAVKLDTFLHAEVILPVARDQQNKISDLLNAAKEEIVILKEQTAAYHKQKRGLMQKLLIVEWRGKSSRRCSGE